MNNDYTLEVPLDYTLKVFMLKPKLSLLEKKLA